MDQYELPFIFEYILLMLLLIVVIHAIIVIVWSYSATGSPFFYLKNFYHNMYGIEL